MDGDFSFATPKPSELPLQNPLMAKATVTDRSDRTATASSRPVSSPDATSEPEGKALKAMAPPARRSGKVPLEKGYSQLDWLRVQKTHKDLSGLRGGRLRDNITLEEVSQHCSRDDAWTVLRGKVYNITPYMRFHPGGVPQLQRGAGIDSTALFLKYHAWVNADMLLEKCLIGFLAKEVAKEESHTQGGQPS